VCRVAKQLLRALAEEYFLEEGKENTMPLIAWKMEEAVR
jgi:hypothetical protein